MRHPDSFGLMRSLIRASVMIIDSPARISYYAGGTLQFESAARPAAPSGPLVRWMEPEGPHSVENIMTSPDRA